MPEEKEAIEIPTRIKYNKALSVTARWFAQLHCLRKQRCDCTPEETGAKPQLRKDENKDGK